VNSRTVSTVAGAIAIMAGAVCAAVSQADHSAGARSPETTARPLMLDRDEGELRTRRIHTDSSAPGFEETMRCNSVAAGEPPTPITPEQQKECAHLGHAESGRMDSPGKRAGS